VLSWSLLKCVKHSSQFLSLLFPYVVCLSRLWLIVVVLYNRDRARGSSLLKDDRPSMLTVTNPGSRHATPGESQLTVPAYEPTPTVPVFARPNSITSDQCDSLHEMADGGRGRSNEIKRTGHESSTTLGLPHADDERDEVTAAMGEPHKPLGQSIDASYGTERNTQGSYDDEDVRTFQVETIGRAVEVWQEDQCQIKRWKSEMYHILPFAGLFVTIFTSFTIPYVVRQSQASSITDALWFTSLSFTLAAASIGVSICQ